MKKTVLLLCLAIAVSLSAQDPKKPTPEPAKTPAAVVPPVFSEQDASQMSEMYAELLELSKQIENLPGYQQLLARQNELTTRLNQKVAAVCKPVDGHTFEVNHIDVDPMTKLKVWKCREVPPESPKK